MDWCIVNWHGRRTGTGNEIFDVMEHESNFSKKLRQNQCHYNKPRWNIAWNIALVIVNALIK